MVSEPILDFGVGSVPFDFVGGAYPFGITPLWHNKDVEPVRRGVTYTPHRVRKKVYDII